MTPTPSIDDPDAWAHWFAAARSAAVDESLRAIYSGLAAKVAARGPVCWASGRCCNFEKFGHRLYVTAIETAWCITQISRAEPALNSLLSRPIEVRGSCPFHLNSLCHAHAMRPLGCRAFFCERGSDTWQHELYEECQNQLRALHDKHRIEYAYAEWRVSLQHAIACMPKQTNARPT